MTEQQADRLFTLISIQTGVTVGIFAGVLVILVNVILMRDRDGH